MYGSTTSNNNGVKPTTTTTTISYDAEIGQDRVRASNSSSNNNNNNNSQSGYTRLVTFMVVVLSLLAVVTLSAGAYVGSGSKNINSSSSVDSTITTTSTESTIASIIPDNSGIINTITESELTFNPTPTALYPTESPTEELDINKAMNIVKELKLKKEVKEAQNKGKIIENNPDISILNE